MKKSELRTMIRQIVREEVSFAIKEVITELKQPTQKVSKQPIVEKTHYSKNPVINNILNETAQGSDWKTMGGTEYTSERMNELVDNKKLQPSETLAASMGVNPNDPATKFLTKDYRGVMKAVEKKDKQKYGR